MSMMTASRAIADLPVVRAASLSQARAGGTWRFDSLVGMLCELSEEHASGSLSFTAEIILDAQDRGEPAAWVAGPDSIFFPPDLHARGVDLQSLAVVRAGGLEDSLAAAEWLVRSGALGLVIVDAEQEARVSDARLGRLQKLAERSLCAVLFLTRKGPQDPSLGSRIAVRGCVTCTGTAPLHVEVRTTRDKRASGASRQGRQYDGPPGLR